MDFYFCKCKWVAAKPVVVDPLLANTTQSNYTTRQNIPIHLDHAEEDNKKDDHNKDDHYKDDPNKEYHKKEDHNKDNHNKNNHKKDKKRLSGPLYAWYLANKLAQDKWVLFSFHSKGKSLFNENNFTQLVR